ncbi:MAG: hypothetical protein JNJ54_21525 [Myxococcaceae bacterium]|nr:hypothetical protein [Myxococcaceae bacterium]
MQPLLSAEAEITTDMMADAVLMRTAYQFFEGCHLCRGVVGRFPNEEALES